MEVRWNVYLCAGSASLELHLHSFIADKLLSIECALCSVYDLSTKPTALFPTLTKITEKGTDNKTHTSQGFQVYHVGSWEIIPVDFACKHNVYKI